MPIIDEMSKIGMEKQQKYDQGVQKIQSQIDNVAGLDVYRPVDKEYLQSKMNELGSNLKTVAAGDFSNFQLVNSVGGMVGQISKDPTIVNAHYSTQLIRKGQKELEAAKKDGKASVQNEAWWKQQVGDYGSSTDLKTTFNGEYVPYSDVDKKLREIGEKVHEMDSSVDIPYQRDSAGNTLYYTTDPKTKQTTASTDPNSGGQPRVDDAMLTIKTKGKPAEKLLSNFMDSLNENDQRQLKIDSWYHYKGVTKDAILNDITNNYTNAKALENSKLVNLNLELTTNTNLSVAQKSALQARINDISSGLQNGALDKVYQSQVAEVNNAKDIEGYKYKTYVQKSLTKLAKDMSYESYQKEYKSNPYEQARNRTLELQFKYDNAKREQNNFNRTFDFNVLKHADDMGYKFAMMAMKGKDKGGSEPVVLPGKISTEVDTPSVAKLQGDIDSIMGVHTPGQPEVMGAIDELNAKYAPVLPGTKSLPDTKAKKDFLDGLANRAATDPTFILKQSAEVKNYLRERHAYEILGAQKQGLYNEAIKQSSKFDADIDKVLGSTEGVTLSNGAKYSAKDLYALKSDITNSYTTNTPSMPGSAMTSSPTDVKLDAKALRDKYKGTRNAPLAEMFIKYYNHEQLSPEEKNLLDRSTAISNAFRPAIGKIVDEKLKFQSDFLAERMPERQTQIGTLSGNNKTDMDTVDRLVGAKNYEFGQGGVDVTKAKDFNVETIKKIRTDPKADVHYTINKKYDGSADLIIESGTTHQVVPMNATEFRAFFPKYSRSNPTSQIKYDILASPFKSTNPNGVTDASSAVTAGRSGYDIPQLASTKIAPIVKMDVNGSAFNNGSGSDQYQVILYVNDNGTWLSETLNNDYVNDAGLQSIINNIGTETVDQILKKHKKQS